MYSSKQAQRCCYYLRFTEKETKIQRSCLLNNTEVQLHLIINTASGPPVSTSDKGSVDLGPPHHLTLVVRLGFDPRSARRALELSQGCTPAPVPSPEHPLPQSSGSSPRQHFPKLVPCGTPVSRRAFSNKRGPGTTNSGNCYALQFHLGAHKASAYQVL